MHIRPAKIEDCADLVILEDIASHGLASWLWTGMAMAAGRPSSLEFAREEVRGDDPRLSYKSATIAEIDDRTAGTAIAYLLDGNNTPNTDDIPEPVRQIVAPLIALSDAATGTWYVNVLAVYPEFRGHGVGAALLERMVQAGIDAGAREMSLITEDDNAAVRLYQRSGFAERERRLFVPFETSVKRDGHWILMVRSL